jgi:magnesium transporter
MATTTEIASLINSLHLEDLRNSQHPSLFDENPGYDMLILRLPIPGKQLEISSFGFILTEKESFLYDRSSAEFKRLDGRFEGPHGVIDPILDHLLKTFADVQEKIADMEFMLYTDRIDNTFMTGWLDMKRDLLRIERVTQRTAAVLKELIGRYEPLPDFPVDHYMDLYEHTERIARAATLQLAKLDYIYNFYNARTNEKMNRLIYLLTVISAIFLPLNLVVGFFGMNTGGLPFAQGTLGTAKALMLMAALTLSTSAVLVLLHKKRVTPKR